MSVLESMVQELWNAPKDKWAWNVILKKNKQIMSDNNNAFLRSQIKAFHPTWSDEEINKEIQRILNDTGDDCLYCGS
jgi:hypothetical protein